MFCSWLLGRMCPVSFKTFHLLPPERYFLFADYIAECNYYAIYLGDNPFFQNRVILPDFPGSPVIAQSFTEFLERYLRDDPKIYGHL